MFNISCNLLNTVLKVKNRMAEQLQNEWKHIRISYLPCDHSAHWELQVSATVQIMREYPTTYRWPRETSKLKSLWLCVFPLDRFICVSSGSLSCIWT